MSLDILRVDTITALSSAQGYGAIAIVRASGSKVHAILSTIFKRHSAKNIEPLSAMHGCIVDGNGEKIDDVMATYFPNKQGFTGEPSCEIYCHGNQLIVKEILELICHHGARLAEP